jgi:hypothetical protein
MCHGSREIRRRDLETFDRGKRKSSTTNNMHTKVIGGKPSGALSCMGMEKRWAHRTRSTLIHLSLSVKNMHQYPNLNVSSWSSACYLLLMLIGATLPHAFMTPPRKIGIYVISHFLNTGSCCKSNWISVLLSPEAPTTRSPNLLSLAGQSH